MNKYTYIESENTPLVIEAIKALASVIQRNGIGSNETTDLANEKIRELIPLLQFNELKKALLETEILTT